MDAYQRRSDFSFMAESSMAVLHPVAFGAWQCMVMRFVSTLIFVKDLPVIGQSTSADICSLGSNLYGQLTAMQ
jgi:hypothetical protein